jgi:hypothetical protein
MREKIFTEWGLRQLPVTKWIVIFSYWMTRFCPYCGILNAIKPDLSEKLLYLCWLEYSHSPTSRWSIKSTSALPHHYSLPPFPFPPFCSSKWSHISSLSSVKEFAPLSLKQISLLLPNHGPLALYDQYQIALFLSIWAQ